MAPLVNQTNIMEFCDKSCSFGPLSSNCKAPAIVKINSSGYHKVCKEHFSQLSKILECQFCESICLVTENIKLDENSSVSVSLKSEVNYDLPQSNEIKFPSLDQNKAETISQENSVKASPQEPKSVCSSCNDFNQLCVLDCSHLGCLSCYSKNSCKVCKNTHEKCVNCDKGIQKFAKFECEHAACYDCINQNCNQCNFSKKKSKCSKCNSLKFLCLFYDAGKSFRKQNICEHPACMNCLISGVNCKLCKKNEVADIKVKESKNKSEEHFVQTSKRSNNKNSPNPIKKRKTLCVKCRNSEQTTGYSCGHNICTTCKVENNDICEICNSKKSN
jgi:hypothetical protein